MDININRVIGELATNETRQKTFFYYFRSNKNNQYNVLKTINNCVNWYSMYRMSCTLNSSC